MEQYGSAKTFKEKWENFWYYNWKYAALAGVFIVVIIAGTITMCARPRFYTSVLVGTVLKGVDAEQPTMLALGDKLLSYAPEDTTGQVMEMDVVDFKSMEYSQSNLAWDVQLTSSLESCLSQLYIFDAEMYSRLDEQGAFMDLSEAFPELALEDPHRIPLRDTALYSIQIPPAKDALPDGVSPEDYEKSQRAMLDDLYLCFRVDNGKHAARRAVQWEMLCNLLAD